MKKIILILILIFLTYKAKIENSDLILIIYGVFLVLYLFFDKFTKKIDSFLQNIYKELIINKNAQYLQNLNFKLFIKIILFILLVFLVLLYLDFEPSHEIDLFLFLFFIAFITFLVLFDKIRPILIIIFFSSYIGLFSVNLTFAILDQNNIGKMSKFDAFNEIKKNKPDLIPWTGVFQSSNDSYNKEFVFSNKSNSNLLFCNETGEWITYKSDKFGFNNDNSIYDYENLNLFIGDSFVEGMCVEREDNLVSQFSKIYDEKIINLGMSGTSQLEQLIILKNYLNYNQNIKKIYWMYSETNDLYNFDEKKRSNSFSFYEKAFSDEFSINNKKELAKFLKNKDNIIDLEINNFISHYGGMNNWHGGQVTFQGIIKDKINFKNSFELNKIYSSIKNHYDSIFLKNADQNKWRNRENTKEVWFEDHYQVFLFIEEDLKKLFSHFMQNIAEKYDIETIFIYNPMWETVGPITNYAKPYVIELASQYFDKIVDLEPKLDTYKDQDLFPNGKNAHYSKSGYKIVSNVLKDSLLEI